MLPLVLSGMITGCYSSQTTLNYHSPHIPSGASIAIRKPANGAYDGEEYSGSGEAVARRLNTVLIRYYPAVEISDKASDYVIKPTILHWEERATEWSGKPDRVSISLQTYNRSGGLLGTSSIEARSSWWTLGGDHPQDLLQKPLDEYARRVAGKSSADGR